MALDWIPGVIQGVGSMASGVWNWLSGHETNQTNERMSDADRIWNWATQQQQNQFNQSMVESANRENRALIADARRYNAMREDTAYQRQVSDMSKAGLNPLSQFNSPSVNPTPVAQNQAFQGNAPSAHRTTPFVAPSLDVSFDGIANALITQKELNQKQQQIDLASIMAGVDPAKLKSGNTNSVISLYSEMLDAQLKNLRKEANSPYVRNEPGSISLLRGLRSYLGGISDEVKEIAKDETSLIDTDALINEAKSKVKNKISSINKKINNSSSANTEQYYYDKAHGNRRSYSSRFKNFFNGIFKK